MCEVAHENGLKRENGEFLVLTLKHVSGLTPMRIPLERQNCPDLKVILNCPGTTKLLSITHENGHKTQKQQVFSHNSQNCLGTPKLWAIAHENGHKTRK